MYEALSGLRLRKKLHREVALSCQIQGKREEELREPPLNTKIYQDCLDMCKEDGLWLRFILVAASPLTEDRNSDILYLNYTDLI